jgi:hypothetical protein
MGWGKVAADGEDVLEDVAGGKDDGGTALFLAIEISVGCERGAESVNGGEIGEIGEDVHAALVVGRAGPAGKLGTEYEADLAMQRCGKVSASGGDEFGGWMKKAIRAGREVSFQVAQPRVMQAIAGGKQVQTLELGPM